MISSSVNHAPALTLQSVSRRFGGVEAIRDISLDIAVGGGLEAAVRSALDVGPSSRALEGQPPEVHAAAQDSVREMLTPLLRGESLPLQGSIWIVTARAL